MLELNLDARGGRIITAIWSIGIPKDCLVRVKCALNSRNNIILDIVCVRFSMFASEWYRYVVDIYIYIYILVNIIRYPG